MRKEDFFIEMDDTLKDGVHIPGNLPIEFDWKFFDSTNGIEGGGTRGRLDHTYYLFHYASVLPYNSLIVEIGTGNAVSTIAMGMGIRGKKSKIIGIDPGLVSIEEIIKRSKEKSEYDIHTLNIITIKNNIRRARLEEYITLIGDTSENVLNRWDGRTIDMLYIDGSHIYEHVKADCRWLKYVREGGIAIFDDWTDDIKRAVKEYIEDKPEWELLTESTTQPLRHPWKTVYWKNAVHI